MPDAYQTIITHLSRAKRVLVTTHIRPDGDAVGSTAAVTAGLRAKGVDARVLLLSPVPPKYDFVYADAAVPVSVVNPEWPADVALADYDTFLVVDTGTWSQLPGLRDRLATFAGVKLVVDHHRTQEEWADAKLVDTAAASATEVVAELLRRWDVPLTEPIATALFLGLVTDTGWFQHSNTRPATHRLAAALMDAGVDTDALQQLIYQNERRQRLALHARVQQSIELLAEATVAVMQVRRDDFSAVGAVSNDTEALINVPLQIRTVQVSVLLTEPPDGGAIRVSLRSKGQIDVAKFAETFGGGGHARAAGLRVEGTLAHAREAVVTALLAAMPGTD